MSSGEAESSLQKRAAEYRAQIPWYVVKRIQIKHDDLDAIGLLKVTCPRRDCGRWFIVKLRWVKGQYRTRPCPYCFRTAFVPHKVPDK